MIRVTFKGLLANRLRFALTALAVMLGVAFMAGTLVYSDTLSKGFDDLLTTSFEGTDAVIRAPELFDTDFGDQRDPVPEAVVSEVLAVDGVSVAEGFVQGYAQLVDREGNAIGARVGPPTLGMSWSTIPELNPMEIVRGGPPVASDEVVIDARSAGAADVNVGDTITVLSRAEPRSFEVTGIATWGSADSPLGASIAGFSLPTAQELVGLPGTVHNISVVADDGVSQAELRDRLLPIVTERGLEVMTGDEMITEGQADIRESMAFFHTFLLVFALIALFVGSFIIFNTFSIVIAQRTREVGLLRAVGATERQVLGGVLLESVVLAAVASALGLVAGLGLAEGLRRLLGTFGLDMPGVRTQVSTSSLVIAFLAGFTVTLVAAVWPARRAAAVPPLAALGATAVESTGHTGRRVVTGVVLAGLGATSLAVGLFADVDGALRFVGAGAAVVFLGVAVLGPSIARPAVRVLAWPLPRLRGMTGELARENALRNPKRTSATASALMVGVAIVSLITIVAGSAKASIRDTFETSLTADYVLMADQLGYGGFSGELAQRVSLLPEVAQTTGVRFGPAQVQGETTLVSGVNPRAIEAMWDFEILAGDLTRLSDTGVAVSDAVAERMDLEVGDLVPMTFARSGLDELRVEAVFAEMEGVDDFVLNMHSFGRNFVSPLDMVVYVSLYENADPLDALAAIESVVDAYPNVSVLDRDEFGDAYAATLDQMLNLVFALLALAIVIALIGIANTLALSIHERTRELGLLRAVGLSRGQLRAVVRWEAVVIALLGAALGVGIGVGFGWAIVTALAEDGITRVAIPTGTLVAVVAIAWLAGVLASLRPAQKAARLDILRAIASP